LTRIRSNFGTLETKVAASGFENTGAIGVSSYVYKPIRAIPSSLHKEHHNLKLKGTERRTNKYLLCYFPLIIGACRKLP
jgi:hypothetical protein